MIDPVDQYRQVLRKTVPGLDSKSREPIASGWSKGWILWYLKPMIKESGFTAESLRIEIVAGEDGKNRIKSDMLPDFCRLAGIPVTNYMNPQIQALLGSKAGQKLYVPARNHWNDHRQGIEPQPAPVVAAREEPENLPEKKPVAVATAAAKLAKAPEKPKPAEKKAIVPPKGNDDDDDAAPLVRRPAGVMLASAAMVAPQPPAPPADQPSIADVATAPAALTAMPTEPQAPLSLLPASLASTEPQTSSAATPENSTAPTLTVPPEVFAQPAPIAPVPATAAQEVATPDASVPAANAQGEPSKASTPEAAPPPIPYAPSLEPIQQEILATYRQIKAHRTGAGAEQIELALYGKVMDGHISRKDLYEVVSKMQHATTDPKMRETVAQLGADLSKLTTQSAQGTPDDVKGKAASKEGTAVIQRS